MSLFDRSLDLRWRRTSYSDITAASHEEWVTSEPEQPLLADEPPGPGVAPIATDAAAAGDWDMPGAIATGTGAGPATGAVETDAAHTPTTEDTPLALGDRQWRVRDLIDRVERELQR